MRAICRLPGERIFNTHGAPENPRVFTSAANTAAVTPSTLRIIQSGLYSVFRARAKAGPSAVAKSRNIRARVYARVAISRRCARAHGGLTGIGTIFLPRWSVCYHTRGLVTFSSAQQKLCTRYLAQASALYPEY